MRMLLCPPNDARSAIGWLAASIPSVVSGSGALPAAVNTATRSLRHRLAQVFTDDWTAYAAAWAALDTAPV
jgi:hypothetical protein